jgi:hypothetical protein
METNKKKPETSKTPTDEELDEKVNQTRSDSDFYQRTFTGTGAPKSDENFDGEYHQSGERDIEDRDNNDGDANTENNY